MRFLFVDRLLQAVEPTNILGLKHVTTADAILELDECGRAYFPFALVGETLGQMAAWHVMRANDFTARPVAGVVSAVRFFRPAYVGETMLLRANIERLDDEAVQYSGEVTVDGAKVFELDGALGPLLPMSQFIATDLVRQQFMQIDRPASDVSALMAATKSLPNDLFGDYDEPQIYDETQIIAVQNPHLMSFDHILAGGMETGIRAIKKVSLAAPYFADHFPNQPVLPMTVLLGCQVNLARILLKQLQLENTYELIGCRKMKMNTFVQPGDVVTCDMQVHGNIGDELVLRSRCEVEGQRVCVLEIVFKKRG